MATAQQRQLLTLESAELIDLRPRPVLGSHRFSASWFGKTRQILFPGAAKGKVMLDPAGSPLVVEIGSHEVAVVLIGLLIVAALGMVSYVLYKLNHASDAAIDAWFDRREQILRRQFALQKLRGELEAGDLRVERPRSP
jgi:hypothetical protein